MTWSLFVHLTKLVCGIDSPIIPKSTPDEFTLPLTWSVRLSASIRACCDEVAENMSARNPCLLICSAKEVNCAAYGLVLMSVAQLRSALNREELTRVHRKALLRQHRDIAMDSVKYAYLRIEQSPSLLYLPPSRGDIYLMSPQAHLLDIEVSFGNQSIFQSRMNLLLRRE